MDAVANPIVNLEDFAPSEPVTKEGRTEYPYRLLCNLTLRSAQEMDCTECVGISTKRLAGQSPALGHMPSRFIHNKTFQAANLGPSRPDLIASQVPDTAKMRVSF